MPTTFADSPTRKGWFNNIASARLEFGYNGTRVGRFTASAITLEKATTINAGGLTVSSGAITFSTSSDTTFSGGNLVLVNDILFTLGTGGDIALVERSSVLNANTALTGVVIGTPVVTAMPADTLIQSNLTANGDFVWLVNDTSGNSWEYLRFDGSAKLIVFNEASNAIDFRIETDNNSNGLTMIASTDSMALGSATVAGAALSLSNLTGRTLVTAVGNQVHVPAGSLTDGGVTGTIAVLAPVFVGAETVLATNTITYTDVAAIRAVIPIASTGATFTRVYGVWSSGQIRADSNFQVNNTAAFSGTQPTASVVFQSGTAPAGTIATGGALYTDGTVMKKIIAAGTVSNIET